MDKILVVGSANVDLVISADRIPAPAETVLGSSFATYLGGKGANQAVAVARAGGRSAFLGKVGNDDFGRSLLRGLEAENVDVTAVSTENGPSGVALIVTSSNGENSIAVAPGANSRLGATALEEGPFLGAALVLCQLETPVDGVIRAAEITRVHGGSFILDPAPARPLPDELLRLVDWLTPNETEARSLLCVEGSIDPMASATALQRLGPRNIIIKMGAKGAVLLEAGGLPRHLPAVAVEAVDTTAAGDAFNGAFAVALSEGAEPYEAARFASAAAAISVTRRGAQPSMARRWEIERMSSPPPRLR